MLDVAIDNLDEVMEFDHVIKVGNDLSVRDTMYQKEPVWAPDVEHSNEHDALIYGQPYIEHPNEWTLLTGFTGQYGYNGPVMHPSEYVGGALAAHILSTPGYYAAVEVRNEDYEYPDGDAIGWAVAYKELEN